MHLSELFASGEVHLRSVVMSNIVGFNAVVVGRVVIQSAMTVSERGDDSELVVMASQCGSSNMASG